MPPGGNSSAKESSKQRSLRIDLKYLDRGDAWFWLKYVWSLLALIAAGAYVVWLGIGGAPAAAQLSPGPLASPHAALNTKCAHCHTEYVSTSAGGEGVNWLSHKLLGADVQVRTKVNGHPDAHVHAGDLKCIVCHEREAVVHHQNQKLEDLTNCASCHADHRGDGASLLRPDDTACTYCHQDIVNHSTGSAFAKQPIRNVSQFAFALREKPDLGPKPTDEAKQKEAAADEEHAKQQPHPRFRSVPKLDENNFKFNHQLHMLPGQWPRGGDAKNAWTPDKLLPGFQDKYGTVKAEFKEVVDGQEQTRTIDVVELKCESCHVPQAANPPAQSGAYMLPIRYEQHCKACHALDLQSLQADDKNEAAAQTEPRLLLPHGLNKREIDEFVAGIAAKLKSGGRVRERYPVRIPGKSPSESKDQANPAQPEVAARIEELRPKIQEVMCGKCHQTETKITPASSEDLFKQAVGFAPPNIPQRWLQHGQFDHRAHRAWAKCEDCHQGVRAPATLQKKPNPDDEKVLIPQIEKCVECHAPANPHVANKSWARFDCAECHRYHPSSGAP